MGDSIEERVYALVSRGSGIPREKLTSASRLSYDLGMEGDDAVEFFERFADEFKVDLSGLSQDWNRYFAPEGVTLAAALVVIGPILLLSFAIEKIFSGLAFGLSLLLGFLIWIFPFYYFMRRRSQRSPQISIQDLVAYAEGGTWRKVLHEPNKLRLVRRS
ncbi:MAG TPA: DUF1493 family protein [Candidatus Acidoferrum sp.]|nr:DUF1493 family protein [Candidatus Acidoferrum sp.]